MYNRLLTTVTMLCLSLAHTYLVTGHLYILTLLCHAKLF